jgi:uncharacterized membrane protein YhhN
MSLKKYLPLLLPVVFMICYIMTHRYLYDFLTTFSCVVIVGIWAVRKKTIMNWGIVVLAFLFSIGGDRMLFTRGGSEMRFIYGIALFFFAHLFYIFFCLKNGRLNVRLFGALVVCFMIYFFIALMPNISDGVLLTAICLYIFVSCLSVAAAQGLSLNKMARVFFLVGISCLVFSDTLISIREFLHQHVLYGLMLPTYYASQILVSAACICSLSRNVVQLYINKE